MYSLFASNCAHVGVQSVKFIVKLFVGVQDDRALKLRLQSVFVLRFRVQAIAILDLTPAVGFLLKVLVNFIDSMFCTLRYYGFFISFLCASMLKNSKTNNVGVSKRATER